MRSLAVAAVAAALALSATPSVSAVPAEALPVESSKQAAPAWKMPTTGKISAHYGYRIHPVTKKRVLHDGTDYANGAGTPVRAASAGIARVVKSAESGPHFVVINHPNGVVTKYAHMRSTTLKRGVAVKVAAGQKVGEIGSEGYSTGNHLHFIVAVNGKTVDPVPFLKKRVS